MLDERPGGSTKISMNLSNKIFNQILLMFGLVYPSLSASGEHKELITIFSRRRFRQTPSPKQATHMKHLHFLHWTSIRFHLHWCSLLIYYRIKMTCSNFVAQFFFCQRFTNYNVIVYHDSIRNPQQLILSRPPWSKILMNCEADILTSNNQGGIIGRR